MKKFQNTRNKLKVEKILKEQLWQYVTIIAIVSLFAWLFNKPFETVLFCISHLVLRPIFEKQYHCATTALCLFTTLTIAMLGIYTCLPISISLLSSIPIATFVCWVGYIAQDRIDLHKILKPNLKTMEQCDFERFCNQMKLTKEEMQIANILFRTDLKGSQLYNAIGYSKRQTIRIKKKIINKLNVTP